MSQQRAESSSRLGRETWAASETKHPTSKSISPVHKRLISLTRQRKNLDAISAVHTGSTVLNSMRRMAARAVSFGIPWCRMSCSTRTAALTLFGWPTEWLQALVETRYLAHVGGRVYTPARSRPSCLALLALLISVLRFFSLACARDFSRPMGTD